MLFQIKQNKIFFKDTDLTEFMDLKEINVDCETDTAYVTAVFKADISAEYKSIVFAMLDEMSEDNLIDIKEECERCLSK